MAIPESQLITWSHQGAVQTSTSTYDSIKSCVDNINWNKDLTYEPYLQGSYKNSTNIYGNSDVDVVLELRSTFYHNARQLPPDQFTEFDNYFGPGKYSLDDFKKTVIEGFVDKYGQANVIEGNKSIKVKGSNRRLDADVVCCAKYREYKSFSQSATNNYSEGITFWTKNEREQIRNFPKQHYDNGVSKNQSAATKYKPTTRIIKNMGVRLIELGRISKDLAPSYYIECLLYNVAAGNYTFPSYQDIIRIVLHNLITRATSNELRNFVCQNENRYLFHGNDPHWDEESCKLFLQQLNNLYYEG